MEATRGTGIDTLPDGHVINVKVGDRLFQQSSIPFAKKLSAACAEGKRKENHSFESQRLSLGNVELSGGYEVYKPVHTCDSQ